jgi:hypothetical protein
MVIKEIKIVKTIIHKTFSGIAQRKKTITIIKQENNNTEYSDKKTNAKFAPEYSVLKPDTNSDSASLKSKGARCVSAKTQTNQIGKRERKKGEEKAQNTTKE